MSELFFDALSVLNAIPGSHLILLPDTPRFTIVGVTNSYLQVTYTHREDIIGKGVFEALTDDVENKLATGIANLSASLHYVVQHKRPHRMAHQRYDVFNASLGRFEYKVWEPVNKPVLTTSGDIQYIIHTVKDVTQRITLEEENQHTQQKLAESESRFRETVELAPVAIALFSGPQFVITLANDQILKFWGRQREQVINRPLFEVIPEASGQGFEGIMTHVYTTGERFIAKERTIQLKREGQVEQTYIDFVHEPFRENGRTIVGVTVVFVDVTEKVLARQRVEESEARYRALAAELEKRVDERTHELRLANQDLTRSNDNLRQFAYVASHDLQEPLRKIQAFSTLLNQQFGSQLNEKAQGYIERMINASARMSGLIKALLSYSRIATRQQTFDPISLEAVVAGVLNTLSLAIEERKAQISIDELPVVNGDESQLSQLFENLLSNAIKFTPADQVPQIQIRYFQRQPIDLPSEVRPNKAAPFYHQISISDEGVGFEMKYVDRIFQVFQRLHGRHEFPGTGVGLAICQRVVENHGGGITANSKPGEGTTFCVYLPA